MKCKINRNAAKVLKEMLNDSEEGKMIRVAVDYVHGDHAHYKIELDNPTEHDEIVDTDKEIKVLLDRREEEWLDGVWIQYFFVPEEEMVITNPSKSSHLHNH